MTLEEAWKYVERGEKLINGGDYENALKNYMRAYRIFLSRKKKRPLREISFTLQLLAQKLRAIAAEQKKMGEYENAARFLLMAGDVYSLLNKNEELEDLRFELGLLAVSLRDDALNLLKKKSPFEAIRYLNISLGICRKIDDPGGEGRTLLLLAIANALAGKSKKAVRTLKSGIFILEKMQERDTAKRTLLELAGLLPDKEKELLLQTAQIEDV